MLKRSMPAPLYMLWIGLIAGFISSSLMALPEQSVEADSMDADYWLVKLLEGRMTPYSGQLLYFSEAGIQTVRMAHGRLDGDEVEHLLPLNSDATEIIRVGDKIHCLQGGRTEEKHYFVRPSSLSVQAPITPIVQTEKGAKALHAQIMQHYSIAVKRGERVAGRDAVQIALDSKDTDRFSRRFWIESNLGLLLKSVTLSEQGQILESMEFVSVEFDEAAVSSQLAQAKAQLDKQMDKQVSPVKYGETMQPSKRAAAVSPGTETAVAERATVSWLPSGYTSRALGMELHDDRRARSAGTNYSDGVSNFTLFFEPAALNHEANADQIHRQRRGATLSLSRISKSDARRITLVGELPEATALRILNAVH